MTDAENYISAALADLETEVRTIFAANSVNIKIDHIETHMIVISIDLNRVKEEGRKYYQVTDSRVIWNEIDYNLHVTMYIDNAWVATLTELNAAFDKLANVIKLSLDKTIKK